MHKCPTCRLLFSSINRLWLSLFLTILFSSISVSTLAAEDRPDPLPLGFHLHHGDALHMTAARQAGAHFGVVVFSWADIEPAPNYFYWERPDHILRTAEFYEIALIARLDRPPAWALDAESPSPWQPDAYQTFTHRVAERYGDRLVAVILWNEPNLALEWHDQTPDPAGFVHLLQAGYEGVKAAAPDLPVLMGGPAMTLGDEAIALNDLDFLDEVYANGGGAFFDGLAAHPYGFGRPPQEDPAPDRLNFRRLELQQAILAEHGDGDRAVWITESGWRVTAPDPADRWQVVTPVQQQAYVEEMLAFAARYPWLQGIALWELNAEQDLYGYNLWHGDDNLSPAYQALVASCTARRTDCAEDPADRPTLSETVTLLAPDAAIRLGDRDQLHPHWVHLYQNGEGRSLDWQGEFFLHRSQTGRPLALVMETMKIDQPGNQIWINGHHLADLFPRSRPDTTSTWVTQRHLIAGKWLHPGPNTIRIVVGQRNPTRQYGWWRYDNFMFRHLRLLPVEQPQAILADWQPLPSPTGWSQIPRMRVGADGSLWVIGNRQAQLWRLDEDGDRLVSQNHTGLDLVFRDVLVTEEITLAATTQGLHFYDPAQTGWVELPEPGLRGRVIHTLAAGSLGYLAGVEEGGLWRSPHPLGPWRPLALVGRTVFDWVELEHDGAHSYYVATNQGIYTRPAHKRGWRRLPPFPADAPGKDGKLPDYFTARLFSGADGEMIARNQDRFWRWDGRQWSALGPSALQGRLVALVGCCEPGTLIGTFEAGLWQMDQGSWHAVPSPFQRVELMDIATHRDRLYVAGNFGLFAQSQTNPTAWLPVDGLPQIVGDLIVDPHDPALWFAATPAGVHRSQDGGKRWSLASPTWMVFDLAVDARGRFWVATSSGLYFTDDPHADPIPWQEPDGLNTVLFFRVNPHPTDAGKIWAGSWGNNIGAGVDGGATFASIHNGLETLSVIDILWHATPGQVTIGTIEGLYRTDDGGESWFKLPGPLGQQTIHALYQSPDGVIWAGATNGLWYSRNYGVNWAIAEDLPAITIHRLGQNTGSDGRSWLWAGSEYGGVWLSADGGASWRFGGLAGRSVFHLLPHPQMADHWLAATDEGIHQIQTRLLLVDR